LTKRPQPFGQSLAEFAPAGANKVLIVFSGGWHVGKNTLRPAKCAIFASPAAKIVRAAGRNLPSKKAAAFFDKKAPWPKP
jgi:hypothetical protein